MKKSLIIGSIIAIVAAYIVGYYIGKSGSTLIGSRETRSAVALLNGVATSTSGSIMDVSMYRNVVCSVDWDKDATMTIKFAGSIADSAPTFTASQSSTNEYDYVEIVDLQSGSSIDGDTGVSVAHTTDHRLFEANVNLLSWFAPVITSWTAGTTTVYCIPGDNK
jgi:hypothetical protein